MQDLLTINRSVQGGTWCCFLSLMTPKLFFCFFVFVILFDPKIINGSKKVIIKLDWFLGEKASRFKKHPFGSHGFSEWLQYSEILAAKKLYKAKLLSVGPGAITVEKV